MQTSQPLGSLPHRLSERIGVIRWKIWKTKRLQAKAKRLRQKNTPRLERLYSWRKANAHNQISRVWLALGLLTLIIPSLLIARPAEAQINYNAGSLLRGQSFSAVYYLGADGLRYVFPTESAYFTWYSDFSAVQTITDAELGKIQIGGNVTYKPGSYLVKINSDPRTYAIEAGGTLRWVTSEAIAKSLYGSTWNTAQTHDIPDGFFANYQIGDPIMSADDYSVAQARSLTANINEDKDLSAFTTFVIEDSGMFAEGEDESTLTIREGETVLFYNAGDSKHSATADDGTWGTGTLLPSEFLVRRFEERGTYDFYDSYDNSLTGTIVVE